MYKRQIQNGAGEFVVEDYSERISRTYNPDLGLNIYDFEKMCIRDRSTVAALSVLDGVKNELNTHIAHAKHNGVTPVSYTHLPQKRSPAFPHAGSFPRPARW